MILTLLIVIAIGGFLLALHPFVTYPLSLMAIRRLVKPPQIVKEAPPAEQRLPDFSICMCAYNEAKVIRQKLQNLLALRDRDPGIEILIYVDAATDDTARLVRAYAPHVQVHVSQERRGKTYGMNLLAARARGSILLFTDANVMLDLDCVNQMRRAFADPKVGCVCGQLSYTNPNDSVTASVGTLYWRLEERIKLLEQETGSVMGADGSLFAVRKSLHRPPPEHIIDDMYVSFMVLLQGYRIVQSQDARAFELSASSAAEEFRRKSRIGCQAFNVHRLIWPELRKLDALTVYKYVSHKLLRWLSIYFLALGVAAGLAALVVAGYLELAMACLIGGSALFALGARWTIKPISQVVDIVTSLAGTGLGVWKSLRGESYQVWTPVATVRKVTE
jgi:cellulose synthase/poly-beta-1,6-N-acetylglucosamine synthase-like glycosyltransferase